MWIKGSNRSWWTLCASLILLFAGDRSVSAQLAAGVPGQLEEVGVTEFLDSEIPLDLSFRDEVGEVVRLGDYFDGRRPVVLTLNYYRCPMLCGLQLNGLVEGMMDLSWTPGQEYEQITVSIDPLETPSLAREKKQNYLNLYGRPSAGSGWHFLTGTEENIRSLAAATGFRYTYDEKQNEYAHVAVVFVLTPDGRLARYLYGIEYPAKDLRLALVEAAEGEIGSTFDQILLYCYHYDPDQRRYAPVAMNIMRLGGGATALLLGSSLGLLWLRDVRRKTNSRKRTNT